MSFQLDIKDNESFRKEVLEVPGVCQGEQAECLSKVQYLTGYFTCLSEVQYFTGYLTGYFTL